MEKILIIDSSMFNQKMMAMYFEGQYEIIAAVNEAVGVQLAKLHKPSLVLLDAEQSDDGGFNLLRTLKGSSVTRNIPVIVMTGAEQLDVEEEAFFHGAADFIRRPLRKKVVCARVRAHINMLVCRRTFEDKLLIDMTTGLPSRKKANLVVLSKWNDAQRDHQPFSIQMMDIDFFKDINRIHGFEQAENVLKQVAITAQKIAQAHGGFIARYEGDKLILLFTNTDAAASQAIAEEIRLAVLEQATAGLNAPDGDVITVSIGGDTISAGGAKGLGECIGIAEKMLRAAKNGGRNCVRHSQPE